MRTLAALAAIASWLTITVGPAAGASEPDRLIASVHAVSRPEGLIVTTGGWAYCEQMRPIARRAGYTLLCGRYRLDGYVGRTLRSKRMLDWGDPAYLSQLAARATALHRETGGELVLAGASYAGFGVAALAARHPELRPDYLVVIDSYLDLLARRSHLPPNHETAREIDSATGGSPAALRARSVAPAALARLARAGTELTFVWSVSGQERRLFRGATCDRTATARTLASTAHLLGRPVPAWITQARHGVTLWRHGPRILRGDPPGSRVVFPASGAVPPSAVCPPVP